MANPSPFRSSAGASCFPWGIFAFAALASSLAAAAPVPIERVQEIAGGVASSVQVSYASGAAISMAQAVSPMEATVSAVASTNNPEETAFYVIDRGSTGGFVVMSADDRLDPVLVIAPSGKFDPTPGSPLYDILCGDVPQRVATAEESGAPRSRVWCLLLEGNDPIEKRIAYDGIASIDDVRVEPIVQSTWNQSTVGGKAVYNYYTPGGEAGDRNNCVCGCVATAGAQILRHHRFPGGIVNPVTRTCYVNGVAQDFTMIGGTYSWNDMPLVPTSAITDTQRMAIGKLCYDVGVSVCMSWTRNSSGAYADNLRDTFQSVFGYANAIKLISSSTISDTVIKNALLANFDAGYPVELSISSSSGGHSIVGDGYGYSSGKLYVHLNLGWGGSSDAWYNLPNIGTGYNFNVVDGSVYNVFPEGTGDLLTGRVLDVSDGAPIEGATVQALNGNMVVGTATTGSRGIYALRLPGGTEYNVVASKSGSETSSISVYLRTSVSTRSEGGRYWPNSGTVGNSWGNDFTLATAPEPVVPTAPVGVSASDGTSTAQVRVTWSASSGATYYKVYRATSNSSSAATQLASSLTSPYYDDTSAEVGTTYYYWVKAGNSSGESGFSASDSGWRAYAVPAAPSGVTASDGTSTAGVIVSWDAVASATSYSVWRSTTSSSASATSIASGLTATSYTDTSAVVGTMYYYWVKATNQGGTSGWSNSDSGFRKMAAPAVPTGVSASDGLSATEIVVSWNAVSTAASYDVWRGTSSSSSSASRIASGLTVTSYSDTSAVAGTTYYYWVKATNAGGTSGFSGSDTGYLAVIVGPSSVTASDGSNSGYVKVSWQASQNATKYEVWRGTVNAYSQAQQIASPTATSYNDTSATPGTLYYYWVRAVTTAGTSAFSSSDSGFRPLSAPTGVAASTGREDGVMVHWAAVTGATSYEIGRGAQGSSASSATMIGTATSLSYKDATAVPGVTYAYFVRAKASACTSAWSSSAAGSRSVPTPTNLTASDGTYTDRILVSWPALSGATSYELMRWTEDDIDSAELIAATTATSFSDTNAVYGVTYYYFLRVNFSIGTSPWSAAEAGWRDFPKPRNVSATDGASTYSITISWDAIEGVSYFQVWRYSELRERKELVGTTVATSYDDYNDIQSGVKYTYYVKAVFPTGTSALSDSDMGYLKASSPAVAASDGTSTSQISLTWNAAAGARAYLVYRSTTSSSADAVQIGSTTMLYYDDTSVVNSALYYYWVRVATAIDTSDFGGSDTGYVALPGVTYVTATDGEYADRVAVSWKAVSGATSYEIWRGDSDDYGKASVVATYITSLSYDDTYVPSGKKVWYWVRAVNAGVGLWGTSDSGWRKLSAPTDVTATTNQTDGVRISWGGDSYGVSFAIYRNDSPTFGESNIVATVSDTTSYTDGTTVPGKIYYYCLRSYSDLGESALSSCVVGNRAVAAPATVSATDGTSLESVTITWTAATSARYYEIWRNSSMDSSTAEMLGTTNKYSWIDFDVVPGTSYYYWIRSVSSIDTSAFTSGDYGYASIQPPTGVTASDGESADYVRVEWIGVDGAQSYAVWRAESENEDDAVQLWTDIVGTTYEDVSASPGKFYWYWVRPVSAAGPGVFAGPDRGFRSLSAPIYVSATSNSVYDVSVSWLWSDGATSFEIFRATTNDVTCATNVVFDTIMTSSYSDTNAVPAVKYWYWVRAVAEAGVSPLSESADGFRLLAAPDGISATDGATDEFVRISWNETSGAEGYEVWRAEGFASPERATLLASVTNVLEFFDTSATPGLWYTYWLRATSELHSTDLNTSDMGWRSPAAPSSVSASDGTTSEGVVVSWATVDGTTQYEIWRSEGEEASTNTARYVTTVSGVDTYTDVGTVVGVQYWYYVRTVCAAGTGVFSLPDDGFRAIAIPTDVRATDGTSYDEIYVTWSVVAGAESYEIRRVPTNELYAATNYYSVIGTTFDDTNAVPGLVYRYWVRAVSPLSTSDYAGSDNGWRKMCSVSLAASDGTSLGAVDLSWTAPTGAVKCQIWRSTWESVDAAIKITTVEGTTYSDTNALHGVKYYYWVNAVSDVEGEMGNYDDGWRALYAPGNIAATDGDSTAHVRITWTESTDATSYEILRGDSGDVAALSVIATLEASAGLAYEDVSGVAGSNYWYSVRAVGTGGKSEPGASNSGYKALDATLAGVSATDGTLSGQVRVTWNNVNGATHYQVYRADSDDGQKTACSGWQTATSFIDTSCRGGVRYWYYVKAAVDGTGARASAFSAGDQGYTNEDGTGGNAVDLGGGITWPVTDNGDGTATTNAIAFTSVKGGRLAFPGVQGAVGSTATVQAVVKTTLESGTVYTVPAGLTIVSEGTAVLDLSTVWGTRPSLFVIGITTEQGEVLP